VTWMAGEEFLVDNIQPTFRSSPKFLLLWGCMAQGYKGPLIWLDLASDMGQQGQEGKTRDRKGGLDEKGRHMLMVQDRAPMHTSQVAKAAQKHLDIHTLAHPPNSPDLNPIELLW
ncbi:hypothetical protein OH76DRAFT_1328717, partial [Lentinus brumalis]